MNASNVPKSVSEEMITEAVLRACFRMSMSTSPSEASHFVNCSSDRYRDSTVLGFERSA